MTNKPTEIIETLESIRKEKYPEIPPELVEQIVEIEYETLENRSQSMNQISNIVESHVDGGEE